MAKKLFTAEEFTRIEQAVKEAETSSGGEIVPVFAASSSFYETALWRGGFLSAVFSGIVLTGLYLLTDRLLFLPPYLWLLIILTAGLLGAFFVLGVPSLKRSLIGKELMQTRVLDQAKNMFYDYRVADTEQRTGILLFISFFEKQAVLLADVGIAEIVSEERWQEIIQALTQKLKQGHTTEGICQAILHCGRLLEESGIQQAKSEANELPDHIRIRKQDS